MLRQREGELKCSELENTCLISGPILCGDCLIVKHRNYSMTVKTECVSFNFILLPETSFKNKRTKISPFLIVPEFLSSRIWRAVFPAFSRESIGN